MRIEQEKIICQSGEMKIQTHRHMHIQDSHIVNLLSILRCISRPLSYLKSELEQSEKWSDSVIVYYDINMSF